MSRLGCYAAATASSPQSIGSLFTFAADPRRRLMAPFVQIALARLKETRSQTDYESYVFIFPDSAWKFSCHCIRCFRLTKKANDPATQNKFFLRDPKKHHRSNKSPQLNCHNLVHIFTTETTKGMSTWRHQDFELKNNFIKIHPLSSCLED